VAEKKDKSIAASKTAPKKSTSPKKTPSKKNYNQASSLKETSRKKTSQAKNKLSTKGKTTPVLPVAKTTGDDSAMTVVEHLDELRSRVLYVLFSIIILTIIGIILSDEIVYFINKPFLETGHKLNIFKLSGGFIIKLKASIGFALLICLPFILLQIWKFIVPAIDKEDRMFARLSLLSSVILFYSGVAFVFFLMLPFTIKMMLGFITPEMISTIGADDYLSFIFLFSIAMGLLFELPIIILILTKIGIITPYFLISKRKYAIVAIWVIGALVTPQDPLSQILVAVPLMFLYEISILISKLVIKRSRKRKLKV